MKVIKILKAVSKYTGIPVYRIKSKDRSKHVKRARFLAIYFMVICLDYTLSELAFQMDYSSHATIIHARNQIVRKMKTSSDMMESVRSIEKILIAS